MDEWPFRSHSVAPHGLGSAGMDSRTVGPMISCYLANSTHASVQDGAPFGIQTNYSVLRTKKLDLVLGGAATTPQSDAAGVGGSVTLCCTKYFTPYIETVMHVRSWNLMAQNSPPTPPIRLLVEELMGLLPLRASNIGNYLHSE